MCIVISHDDFFFLYLFFGSMIYLWGVRIAELVEHWSRDRKAESLNAGGSGGTVSFSRVNFLR